MNFTYRHGDRPLDGYTLLRGIGRGGFGEVYYAVSDGGREVALKLIQQNHEIELRGVRHCMNLKSPHLVSIFDVRRNDADVPFVIMEFVSGPSLRDILRDSPGGLDRAKAAYLVREIGRGLDYLHERGIVHRDLKPENIFYEDGFVKIGDYGLSKYISVSRRSGQTISVGTVHYMAPEIGSGNYHRGIDIYALGVILYELLTGKVPYDGDSMAEILMKHLTAEPDLSALEPCFREVVRKALAKKPDQRYGSASEMLDELFADAELAKLVDGVDPSSFGSVAPELPPLLEIVADAPAASSPRGEGLRRIEEAETLVTPPSRPAPADAPPAPAVEETIGEQASKETKPPQEKSKQSERAAAGRKERPEALSQGFGGVDLEQRIAQGIATAAGMALALSLPGFDIERVVGSFVTILAGSVAILAIEHWAVPRFGIDVGIAKRLMTLGLAGPALAAGVTIFDVSSPRVLPSIFLALLLIQWHERTRPWRAEPASLGQAFYAGLCGFICTYVFHTGSALYVGGMMASLSLVLNAASPYGPRTRALTKRRKGKEAPPAPPHHDEPPAQAAVEVAAPVAAPIPAPIPAPVAASAEPSLTEPGGIPTDRFIIPAKGGVICGVCAAIANRYGWDPLWVRLAFALALFVSGGLVIIAYLVCDMSMEHEGAPRKASAPSRAAPAQTAAAPTRPAHGETRLVRPLGDRMVAGVCSGIATRYGWEVVWVRVATLGLCVVTVGYGLLAYLLLWFLMPSADESPQAIAPASRRGRSGAAKFFWYTLLVALAAGGIGLTIAAGEEFSWASRQAFPGAVTSIFHLREELVAATIGAAACFALTPFALFRARARTRLRFWEGWACPLLLAAAVTVFGASVGFVAMFRLVPEEKITFGLAIFGSGLAATFLLSSTIAAARRRGAGDGNETPIAETHAGWASLGTLLVVSAIALVALGTLFAAGLGTWIDTAETQWSPLVEMAREGTHLLPALGLFLPGMFCLLVSRRSGGGAHVVRGALGWTAVGLLLGLLSILLPRHVEVNELRGASLLESVNLSVSFAEMLIVFLVGVLSIVCLAWPGRPTLHRRDGA